MWNKMYVVHYVDYDTDNWYRSANVLFVSSDLERCKDINVIHKYNDFANQVIQYTEEEAYNEYADQGSSKYFGDHYWIHEVDLI